jgi:ketosteroid isomerase-like protein
VATQGLLNLQRAFAAFTAGDMETVGELIDPEFEVDDRVVPEASPTRRGAEALAENAEQVKEAFGDVAWEPREVIDLDDRILVRVHVTGKGQATALPIATEVGHVYTMRNGKAVRLVILRTWEEAKDHAGISG